MKKLVAIILAATVVLSIPVVAFGSANLTRQPYDPKNQHTNVKGYLGNGILMDRGSWGIYECWRSSDDYYGWVFFMNEDREPHMWLDGRGSCIEGIEDPSNDIGSGLDDVKIWTGNDEGHPSYRWQFVKNSGDLKALQEGLTIGVSEVVAGNPHRSPADIYIDKGTEQVSLADLIDRVAALEAAQ